MPLTYWEMCDRYGTERKIAEAFLDDKLDAEELECVQLKFNKMAFSRLVAAVAIDRLDRRLGLGLFPTFGPSNKEE